MSKIVLVMVFGLFALSSTAHALHGITKCDSAKLNGGCPATESCDGASKTCKDVNFPATL